MIISPFGEDSTDAEFDADSYGFVMIRNICFSMLRGAWGLHQRVLPGISFDFWKAIPILKFWAMRCDLAMMVAA